MVLAIPHSAGAVTLLPPKGKVFTGVAMGYSLTDFVDRVGHKPAVWGQFVAVGPSAEGGINPAPAPHPGVMLAVKASPGQGQGGSISPGRIAAGHADRWLVELRAQLGDF